MCNPSALGQDSSWMAAKQNCESSQKKCGYQTLAIDVISNSKNSNTEFQGLSEANRVGIHNCLPVPSKEEGEQNH